MKEKRSTIEIGKLVGVSDSTAAEWLKESGVAVRSRSEAARVHHQKLRPPPEQLRQWYFHEQRSTYQIADMLGVVNSTVRVWLREAGIPRRTSEEIAFLRFGIVRPSREQLRKWYVTEKKSTVEIGNTLGVYNGTVGRWPRQYGISRTG